jgi:ribosomal-protein-alanine N-acetyltransferase
MNSPDHAIAVRFEAMTDSHLDAVTALELQAHAHPWQKSHFADCLASAYQTQLLMAGDTLLGYFVAMKGVDEVHLLNLTVAPAHQRQGWARLMLDALALWSRGQGAQWVWLEVRESNAPARALYERCGFAQVGVRKGYYPAGHFQREDAVVMSLNLVAAAALEARP